MGDPNGNKAPFGAFLGYPHHLRSTGIVVNICKLNFSIPSLISFLTSSLVTKEK